MIAQHRGDREPGERAFDAGHIVCEFESGLVQGGSSAAARFEVIKQLAAQSRLASLGERIGGGPLQASQGAPDRLALPVFPGELKIRFAVEKP